LTQPTTDPFNRPATRARRGDTIALSGPRGAGKTSFARGFIRARAALQGAGAVGEVPSPTFTLVQIYDLPGGAVWHVDLYRLTDPAEVFELGLDDAFADAITLIEWPERAGDLLPADRLDLTLSFGDGPDGRRARLDGRGHWLDSLVGVNGLVSSG
jgi:tRNA threonylcarbamoyladenosine biosynthesis protein TsaE